jgi:hypothetical protein
MNAPRGAAAAFAALAALAACASDGPVPAGFDDSGGSVPVRVLADGFVVTGPRRIPLEAFVLELRQRTRAMAPAELRRFVVAIDVERGLGADAEVRVRKGVDRLYAELEIMGVKQIRHL